MPTAAAAPAQARCEPAPSDNPHAMAAALLSAVQVDTAASERAMPPLPDNAHPPLLWAPWRDAHATACLQCRAGQGASCELRGALWYLLCAGHHPSDLKRVPAVPSRAAARRAAAYARDPRARPSSPLTPVPSASPAAAAALAKQVATWEATEVLVPAPDVTPSQHIDSGGFTAAMFTVVTVKPVRARGAELAAVLRARPGRVGAMWVGDFAPKKGLATVKVRVITDARPLNAACPPPPAIAYPTVAGAALALLAELAAPALEGNLPFLFAVDYAQGYTSVRLAVGADRMVAVLAPDGKVLLQRRLPFGYAWAAFLFCLLSGAAAVHAARAAGPRTRTWTYVDDTLFLLWAPSLAAARAAAERAVAAVRRLGFVVHLAKLQGPAATVTWLGADITVAPGGVALSVPEHTAHLLAAACDEAAALPAWPRRAWQRLLGKLVAVWALVPGSRWRTGTLFRLAGRPGWHSASPRKLFAPTQLQREALTWWSAALLCPDGRTTGAPCRPRPVVGVVVGASDASGEEGIGAAVAAFACGGGLPHGAAAATQGPSHPWGHRVLSLFLRDARPALHLPRPASGALSSTALELAAVVVAVRAAVDLVRGSALTAAGPGGGVVAIRLFTDSQAAVALLTKGYCLPCDACHAALKAIDDALGGVAVLSLTWRPREANVWADALSHPDSAAAPKASLSARLRLCRTPAEAQVVLQEVDTAAAPDELERSVAPPS